MIRKPTHQPQLAALPGAAILLVATLASSCVFDSAGTLNASGGGTATGTGSEGGSGGSTSGGGGIGGVGGQGGVLPECTDPSTCPGIDDECGQRTCEAGSCGLVYTAAGTECAGGGSSCDGAGACLKDLGTTCSNVDECHSGFCSDSVCCDQACDGDCVGCALLDMVGTCSPHPAASDPDGDCTAAVCSGAGSCVGGAPLWAITPTSTGNFSDYGWEVVVDSAGDVIVNGDMYGPLDLGGGAMPHGGNGDLWIAKLSAAGSLTWSHSFGGVNDQTTWGLGVDANDNIFVAGHFEGVLDFGGSASPLTGTGNNPDVYVAKLDKDGSGLWARHFDDGLGDGSDLAYDLAVHPSGDVIIAGHFEGSIAFGANTYTSVQQNDVFVARLNGNTGAPVWSSHFGGNQDDLCYGVAVDSSGDVIITGRFESTLNLGSTLTSAGAEDVFIAEIDGDNGSVNWANRYGDNLAQRGTSVAIGPADSIFVTGAFQGDLDLGGGHTMTAVNGLDGFVVKLDTFGAAEAARRFGGTGTQRAWGIAVNADGQVLVTGQYQTQVDLGAGMLPAVNGYDIFLARYDASLDYVWGQVFSGTGDEFHAGVAFGQSGEIFTAGFFAGTLSFGGPTFTAVQDDAFIAAFEP